MWHNWSSRILKSLIRLFLEPSMFYNSWVRFGMLYIHNHINFLIPSYTISTAMVFCAAVWCCSESGKSQDISFYCLPRDQTLRATWLQKLKRDNLPSKKYIRVCRLHFEDECFKQDLEVCNNLLWRFLMTVSFSYFVMSCINL